ncbi:MAG: GNAT family N-acetyltransferase [Planctomycetaceae bacterium]
MPSAITIRDLLPSEAPAFQALRLRGLRECPAAFASSAEEEGGESAAEVAARLAPGAGRAMLGAFSGVSLVGFAGLQRESFRKLAHKVVLWGMIVAPESRRTGVGRLLVVHALQRAFSMPGVRQVTLGVNANNSAALALYESCGFERFGLERQFLLLDGVAQDEIHMVRFAPAR